jgi:hypothetical protein
VTDISLDTAIATGSSTARTMARRFAQEVNVLDFGAVGDTKQAAVQVTTTSGSATLQVGTAVFASTDVGKFIQIVGAGASGGTLSATISGFTSATVVTLNVTAGTSLSASTQTIFWGTDDSPAIAAAASYALSLFGAAPAVFTVVNSTVLYFPPGAYYFKSTQIPRFIYTPVSIMGSGVASTIFIVDPTYQWDLFYWAYCWSDGSDGGTTYPTYPKPNLGGVSISGFRVIGNLNSQYSITGLNFANYNDYVYANNIWFDFWPGRVIYGGGDLYGTETASFLRESSFCNIRAFHCGTAVSGTNCPVIEFSSVGAGDATNEIQIENINIFSPNGHGVVFRNKVTNSNSIRLIKAFGLRIENNVTGTNALQIGDTGAAYTGGISIFQIEGIEIVSAQTGSTAINISAVTSTSISSIRLSGAITNCQGYGVNITAGTDLYFDMTAISAIQGDVVVNNPIGMIYFLGAAAGRWNYVTTNSRICLPTYNQHIFSTSGGRVMADLHDGTTGNGNTIGAGSTDLQKFRTAQTQIAGATYSAVLAGSGNAISAVGLNSAIVTGTTNVVNSAGSFIGSGNNNTINGAYSSILGRLNTTNGSQNGAFGVSNVISGNNSYAFGSQGVSVSSNRFVQSGGAILQSGDAQISDIVLRASTASTSAVNLTCDGSGIASSVNTASVTLPSIRTLYAVDITVAAIDRSSNNNWLVWKVVGACLYTIGGVSNLVYTGTTPSTTSAGTGSSCIVTPGADTVNGALSLTFTAPNANSWHVTARISFTEVA